MAKLLALLVLLVGCAAPPMQREARRETDALQFGGDVYFGEAYGTSPDDYARPLASLRPLLQRAPVIVNFESTLSPNVASELADKKLLLHWANDQPTTTTLADHGIAALSLANNHTMDYGIDGLLWTRDQLKRGGLASFGAGVDPAQAGEPFFTRVGSERVAIVGAYWQRPIYDQEYRFYAGGRAGGVRKLAPDVAAQIGGLDATVVVFPHWGRNYRWRNAEQRRLAHAMVDAGADLIVGHGAHNMQEIERHRGAWILYGIGNLVFLSPGRYRRGDVPPYSILATLRPTELQLRFIASDNRRTNYRPYVVDGDEFRIALDALAERSCRGQDDFCRAASVGADEHGSYVTLPRQ